MDSLFNIFRLGAAEAGKIILAMDEPHNHDFEELIIGIEGNMEHFIDFKSEKYLSPFVSFVTEGKVHKVMPEVVDGKFDFWVLEFRGEFIPDTTFQLYSYYHDHANLQLQRGDNFNRMVIMCEMMNNEAQKTDPDYAVIRLLLSTLFTMIESERKKSEKDENNFTGTQNITFKNFLRILEENYRRPEGVDFYAEKLFMSSRNLNIICHNILQKSVSEMIETRKLIEAKNLLISTDKSVSEIGFELGYNEKAYFTTVFKKKSGITPTKFREEMRKLIS
jgi:AraC family transcriptional regulator, transcriptional activator of pobA